MACESEKAEREAGKLLLSLGGTPNYYGFRYTVYGVALVIREEAYLLALTKRLYPDIARMYQASAETVEHAIRHAIEAAWQRGDERTQKKLFGYSHMEGRRPTNSEFITRLADYFTDMSGKYLS